jgi:hypothetical protein
MSDQSNLPLHIKILIFICGATVFLLAVLIIALDFLTISAAGTAKCVGQILLAGYPNNHNRIWFSSWQALWGLAGILIFSLGVTRHILLKYDRTLFNLTSIRVSLGIVIVCALLVSSLGGVAETGRETWMRYRAISNYCYQS